MPRPLCRPSLLAAYCVLASSLVAATQVQIPMRSQSHSQGYFFDPLLHLPGISPYFDAIGSGLNHQAPDRCEVTAATYLVRHAAIYANDKDYEDYIEPFLVKLNSTYPTSGPSRDGWTGPLSFFDKWKTPIPDPERQLEEITPQGKKDSKKVAKHLLDRYPKLVPTTKRLWADKKSRTQDTAKAFAAVFPQKVEVREIKLDGSLQAQVPHKACDAFSKKPGDEELDTFAEFYTAPIVSRLQPFAPVGLEKNDIIGLQQLCGYESAITGHVSEICSVFTDAEWMAYEYAWDMKYHAMVGPGNPLSPYLGFPWLNTTSHLMSKFHSPLHGSADVPDDDGQRFFVSFTHREVPPFLATALGLFNSSNAAREEFPTDRINWSRSWRMADLIPFLGHIGIEMLTCEHAAEKGMSEYIRVIANSSPRPIPGCQDGPGASCGIDAFTNIVDEGMKKYGDFDGVCKKKEDSQ